MASLDKILLIFNACVHSCMNARDYSRGDAHARARDYVRDYVRDRVHVRDGDDGDDRRRHILNQTRYIRNAHTHPYRFARLYAEYRNPYFLLIYPF